MKITKPTLSIQVLSSGRKDTIERCLSSLTLLRKKIDTEIIVVDTDPNHDETVRSIIEKYADMVVPFVWCDDFAAARNAGLLKCSGEWLLFIDDDEWFMDHSVGVTSFLTSSNCGQYDMAQFAIRNYLDEEGKRHSDTYVTRLFRLYAGARFVGKIHEYLVPAGKKKATISATIGHTGYAYTTKEEKELHARRNIRLLEEMRYDEPQEARWLYQLVLEYDSLDDRDKIRELCEQGIHVLDNKNTAEAADFRGLFIAERLRMERLDEDTREERRLYEGYCPGSKVGPAADAYLSMEGARIYFILGEDEKSRSLCDAYLAAYEKHHDTAAELSDITMFFLSAAFSDDIHGVVMELVEKLDARKGQDVISDITLSISLLSSGRSSTIERCLSSLVQIKNNIPTEIVVVDTDAGKDRSVRTVLEQYADRIIPFTWCDDFAAARNVGLAECCGEWFLFIDDDEWLIDAQPIIDFLTSQECGQYRWCNMVVRNYRNTELTESGDVWVTRLVRRRDNTRFVGRIHEYLSPLAGEPKGLSAVIGHTGYIYHSEEERKAHARRNITLLEKSIDENPNALRWHMQLLQEYDDIENWQAQRQICRNVLEALNTLTIPDARLMRGLFTAAQLRIERRQENWEEEKRLYEASQGYRDYLDVADAYISIEMALCELHLDNEPESSHHCSHYLELYEKYHGKEDELTDQMPYFLRETFGDNLHDLALSIQKTWEQRRQHAKANRPLLTISLLSSGRSGTIEKCLVSLEQLRREVPTEVIVVDTDPNHRKDVKNIVDRYADVVIPFVWCDDFSMARNAGLSAARGQWFMMIDDDEWLIDGKPIAEFLVSDDAASYHWANCRIRNYRNEEFSSYYDSFRTTLIRLDGTIHYEGAVHETPVPLLGEPKALRNAMIGHSGYIFANKAEFEAHSKRNMTLLKGAVTQSPGDIRMKEHLVSEYWNHGDLEEGKTLCEEAFAMLEGRDDYMVNAHRGVFAAYIIRYYGETEQWDEGEPVYRRLREREDYSEAAKAYMDMQGALLYFNLRNYLTAYEFVKRYFARYEKYHGHEDELMRELVHVVSEVYGEAIFALVVSIGIFCETLENKWDIFDRYFKRLRWDDRSPYDFRDCEGKILTAFAEVDYDPHFARIAEVFWSGSRARHVYRIALKGFSAKEQGRRWNLVHALDEAELKTPIPWDMKILWADHVDDDVDYEKMYLSYFTQSNPLETEQDLWEIAKKHTVEPKQVIAKMDFPIWRRCVEHYLRQEIPAVRLEFLLSELQPESSDAVHLLYASFRLRESLLDRGSYTNIETEHTFIEHCLAFYQMLYKQEALSEKNDRLPASCIRALHLQKMAIKR